MRQHGIRDPLLCSSTTATTSSPSTPLTPHTQKLSMCSASSPTITPTKTPATMKTRLSGRLTSREYTQTPSSVPGSPGGQASTGQTPVSVSWWAWARSQTSSEGPIASRYGPSSPLGTPQEVPRNLLGRAHRNAYSTHSSLATESSGADILLENSLAAVAAKL